MPISKIGSKGVKDAELTADDLAPGTITNAKLADATIENAKLAGSIANDKLANSSVTLNGTAVSLGGSADIGTQWQSVVTGNTTMVAGRGYFVDNSSSAITMTLPASPSAGDTVKVVALSGTTYTVTIGRNSSNIQGEASDRNFTQDNQSETFIYSNATEGWTVESTTVDPPSFISATGGTTTTSGNYKIHTFLSSANFVVCSIGNQNHTAEYLVVAGGASGATQHSGGGGAGGYRTNYPSPDVGGFSLASQTYPITVGGGGTPQPGAPGQDGNPGSNSVFSTITSTGGGGGGSYSNRNGLTGGSGGGAGSDSATGGAGNTPPVSPPQGNPGGNGAAHNTGGGGGGGGGGSAAAGQNAVAGPTGYAGNGGAGTQNNICGNNYYHAGGGGAGIIQACSPVGSGDGGIGGGGGGGNSRASNGGAGGGSARNSGTNGSYGPPDANGIGGAGGANTGGGGGGSGSNSAASGAGGSGVVVLRYRYQ